MQLQVLADSLNRDRDRQLVLERSLKDANLSELMEDARARRPRTRRRLPRPSSSNARRRRSRDMQSTLTEQHPDLVAMKQTIAELRKRAEAESARQGADAPDETPRTALRSSRLEDLRAELSAVRAAGCAENGRRGTASQRPPQLSEAHRRRARARSGAGGADARLRHAPADLPRPAGQEAGVRDCGEPRAAADRRAFQGSRSGAAARAAIRPEPRPSLRDCRPCRIGNRLDRSRRVLERFDRRLRTQDDVLAALGLPVLAAIPLVSASRPRVGRTAAVLSVGTAFRCVRCRARVATVEVGERRRTR